MSYDKPNRLKYSFGIFDFGGGADQTFYFRGPKGKKGRVWDYGVQDVTEAFAAGTNKPRISVGLASDLDAYGVQLDMGTLADDDAQSIRSRFTPAEIVATYVPMTTAFDIPADTKVGLACVAGTGSGLTGMAVPFCIIDWDD